MLMDGNKISDKSLSSPICIIGSGPAGISLALSLAEKGIQSIIIEAGPLEPSSKKPLLKGHTFSGMWYNPQGSKLMQVGGTSGHWAGYCAPLDDEDFNGNDIFNTSTWPFSKSELNPFYQKASAILEIEPYNYQAVVDEQEGYYKWNLQPDYLQEKVWHFSPPVRFAKKYKKQIEASDKIDLLYNSCGIELLKNKEGKYSQLKVRTLQGAEFVIQSSYFVLAAGAVDNARFLLNNKTDHPNGLGNQNDLVGRYFADHFHLLDVGTFLIHHQQANSKLYRNSSYKKCSQAAFIQIPKKIRAKNKWPNLVFRLEWDKDLNETGNNLVANLNKLSGQKDIRKASITVMGEQAPNFDSRISLIDQQDDYGMPFINMHWHFEQSDLDNYKACLMYFAREVAAQNLGRVYYNDKFWTQNLTKQLYGGNHHLGTTRMATKASEGVVDEQLKIHNCGNVFVAGSSVFPCFGSANPTFTIVALSLRLAEHLHKLHTKS